MVRLKEVCFLGKEHQGQNFNSSMVRLKACTVQQLTEGFVQFQFLYGAIKSVARFAIIGNLHEFQFLYGAIKRSLWYN